MTNVHITIDAECSMGGAWTNPGYEPVAPERAVLGRVGDTCYGVPLIMDILEEHGLRGTFFIEVLAGPVVGERALAAAYESVLARGHDAQLHAHPVYRYYGQVRRGELAESALPPRMDLIGSLPVDVQRELLEEARALFVRYTGKTPTAFRAGNYGASAETLKVLDEMGFTHDSSFNAAYTNGMCLVSPGTVTNTPWQVGGLWEVPVTSFRTGSRLMRKVKPLDIAGVSFPEIRRVLEQAERTGPGTVTMVLHSFSFLKRADVQFRRMKPDRLVIGRFRRLCRFLATERARFPVRTFAGAGEPRVGVAEPKLPALGTVLPAWRRLVQGVNRFYWALADLVLRDLLPSGLLETTAAAL
jgi:peptidoglycan/xylan/chitin deacetylase (PgdA/CDA1 family)